MRITDWRAVLVYTHRWLGIAFGCLIVAWFASGIVMMYARMPRLTAEERLARAEHLDLRTARVEPMQAAAGLDAERLRVGMLQGRPVYRLHDGAAWTTVFADSGERLDGVSQSLALAIVRTFAPEHAATMVARGRVETPDQWMLQSRALLPAQQVALGDRDGTHVYVSERTGEPVLKTTRAGRGWGYAGAVVHWIYFTPIRRHSDAWAQLIVWTSIVGCGLCLTGLVWALWRFSPSSRFRLRGVPQSHTPYAGMMRWHHYTGLAFGVVTLSWIFSGLLSMNPWDWSPSTSPTRAQRHAVAGGPFNPASVSLRQLRRAADALALAFPIKEIELLTFRGEMFAEAYRPPDVSHMTTALGEPSAVLIPRLALDRLMISLDSATLLKRFDPADIAAAADRAMPGTPVVDLAWLDQYDAYYYNRQGTLPLPVVRVRYADAVGTWLYLDPQRGVIVRKEERLTRLNRWLYHGLHSLDFPWLYPHRPWWDLVVIALSLGGIGVAVTSSPAAWRRLRRHVRRWRRRIRGAKLSAER